VGLHQSPQANQGETGEIYRRYIGGVSEVYRRYIGDRRCQHPTSPPATRFAHAPVSPPRPPTFRLPHSLIHLFSQRPPAKPEACRRWSGSKPLGPSERLLRIRSRWVLRAFGASLSSTIGDRHGTSFTPGDAPLPGASHCSPLPIPTGAPISGPGCIPGIVKLWEPPRQSRGVSRSSRVFPVPIPSFILRAASFTCLIK
jgi:hypothetical protein